MTQKIAIQGELGSYSHEACRNKRPDMEVLPCRGFEDAINAVRSGEAELAMLPVENTTYGRVADIHRLLPESGFAKLLLNIGARKFIIHFTFPPVGNPVEAIPLLSSIPATNFLPARGAVKSKMPTSGSA